jgi:hypothetical protein
MSALCRVAGPPQTTCRPSTCRHVVKMSQDMSATRAMSWLAQDDIGRHLSRRASFALASQMSRHKYADTWLRYWLPVTASATLWRRPFSADIVGVATTRGDMSATFPTKLVWPSSVGHVPRGSMILLSTQLCYFVDHDLRDRVNLVGRGFEPWTKQYDFCIGPGFDSQARSPVSGQCDPWPMSLAPTNGELGWCGKNLMGKNTARGKWSDFCKHKT